MFQWAKGEKSMSDSPEKEQHVSEANQSEKPASLESIDSPKVAKEKNNQTLWIVLAVIGLCLIFCCVGTLITVAISNSLFSNSFFENLKTEITTDFGDGTYNAQNTLEQSFAIEELPTHVIIKNEVGDTTIRIGSDDEIYVSAALKATGNSLSNAQQWLDQIDVSVEQDGDTLYITGKIPSEWLTGHSASVDLDITIPADAIVDITTEVGSITVSDIEGSVSVDTSVGDIEVKNLTGVIEASTGVGDITISDWRMSDDSTIETGVGDIEVELDRSQSLDLDAKTGLGDIACEFDIDDNQNKAHSPSDSLAGTIGDDPAGELALSTGTGSIVILQD